MCLCVSENQCELWYCIYLTILTALFNTHILCWRYQLFQLAHDTEKTYKRKCKIKPVSINGKAFEPSTNIFLSQALRIHKLAIITVRGSLHSSSKFFNAFFSKLEFFILDASGNQWNTIERKRVIFRDIFGNK